MRDAAAHKLFKPFITDTNGELCYMAGIPNYERNFSRDTILSGIIATDEHLLENQLLMSLRLQGQKSDSITGEEPGKIHHEYPGVMKRAPYYSTYNGCDTTALYLIGLEILWRLNKHDEVSFLARNKESVEQAVSYIQKHIKDDIFWEFPPAPAKHFSLDCTYWKDSVIPDIAHQVEASYPIAYGLVQFQVARGLLAAANILKREDLGIQADKMFRRAIKTFIQEEYYSIKQDDAGSLKQISSDELHALAYTPVKYKNLLPEKEIIKRAEALVTDAGIACSTKEIGDQLSNKYHGYVVWMFEQALINYGCLKFGFSQIGKVAERCQQYIGEGQELVTPGPVVIPMGNNRQLWSVAAKIYFSDMPSLRQVNWL